MSGPAMEGRGGGLEEPGPWPQTLQWREAGLEEPGLWPCPVPFSDTATSRTAHNHTSCCISCL